MSNWLKAKNNGSKSRDKSNGDGKMEFHKTEWNRDENRQRIAWRRGRRRGKGWKDLATEVRINKNGGGAEPRAWSYVSGKKTRRVDAILGSVNDVCSLNRRRI